MKKIPLTPLLVVLLTFLSILSGYNYFFQPFYDPTAVEEVTPTPAPVEKPQQPSDEQTLLESVSTQDKIATLIAFPVTLDAPSSVSALVKASHPVQFATAFGSGVSVAQASTAIDTLKNAHPSLLVLIDHEGGEVQRLSGQGFTQLPSWQEICSESMNQSERISLFQRTAKELSVVGVDVVLGPTVDVGDKNAVLKSRLCSSDSNTVVAVSLELSQALAEQKVSPVFKHFPGIGKTTKDLHTNFDQVTIGPIDAQVFHLLLEKYPRAGVMTTHVGVNNQDGSIPCSMSVHCVGELSREYPDVLILSDALEMESAGYVATSSSTLTLLQRSKKALEAGNMVLVFGPSVTQSQLEEVQAGLAQEYQSSEEFRAILDQRYLQTTQWIAEYAKEKKELSTTQQ